MSERPTFSPFWHRVRAMAPRLRPHVQITRQHYRGRRWHVVHDPATNQFYRLNPIAHEFVGLLDGRRTVEEVWTLSLERHGDMAPTQNEVIQLISQLYQSNLLSVDATPETEQLLRRGRERFKKKAQSQAIGIMYFRIRVFNPDRLVSWVEPILRPILNLWGFLVWCAVVIAGLVALVPHIGELADPALTGSILAPSNWGWLIVVFIVTKGLHELGHGVICKRFGGQVPEFGFMLLVLFPAPYVDASAAWAFDNKWRRIAVGAGGMLFELLVAAIAAFVWINTREGLVHQIAYNVIFTASVSTILFNANPLMRFDGYYILSDLLEIPNLMQRSMNQLKYFFQKYVYRVENPTPPSSSRSETALLYIYGVCATAYRIFLFFSITLYVLGRMFALGLVLAIWTGAMWFIMPVGKFVHWQATSPQLAEFRPRAVLTSLAMIVLAVGTLGLIPFPDHRRAMGVVESERRSGVYVGTAGFVTEVHARPGDAVNEGDAIVVLQSPRLESAMAELSAKLAETQTMAREAAVESPAGAVVARQRAEALREQVEFLRVRLDRLTVRAPHDGVVVGPDPTNSIGSYLTEGEGVCEVVDLSTLRVAAVMGTAQAAPVIELGARVGGETYAVELRTVADAHRTYRGGRIRMVEAGQYQLPHASLGFSGGGSIETDTTSPQAQQSGLQTKAPQFIAYIYPPDGSDAPRWVGKPGERVHVRFTLDDKPLLFQWVDRLHKLVQGRINI